MEKPIYWLIDGGNTRLKIALYEGHSLEKEYTGTALPTILGQLENWPQPTAGICSNVGHWDFPEWGPLYGGEWIHLTPQTPLPIELQYETPHTLGNDRRALAVAGATQYPGRPVLVIDAGSCVTYDLINAAGIYLGGAISPGLNMRLRAMHHFTASLPLVDLPEEDASGALPNLLPGKSTQASLQAGAWEGWRGEVLHFISSFQRQYSGLITVVTGGDMHRLVYLPKSSIFARPKFLLSGLKSILEYNTL